MAKEFSVSIICGNCGNCDSINVEKGVLVVDYLRKSTEICANCGCRIDYKTYKI